MPHIRVTWLSHSAANCYAPDPSNESSIIGRGKPDPSNKSGIIGRAKPDPSNERGIGRGGKFLGQVLTLQACTWELDPSN